MGDSFSTIAWMNTMLSRETKFKDLLSDVSSGKSNRDDGLDKILKQYRESNGQNYDTNDALKRLRELTLKGYSKKLTDEEWATLVEDTNTLTSIMEYYNGTYGALPTEKEREQNEAIEKAKEELRKAISDSNITLRGNQSIA